MGQTLVFVLMLLRVLSVTCNVILPSAAILYTRKQLLSAIALADDSKLVPVPSAVALNLWKSFMNALRSSQCVFIGGCECCFSKQPNFDFNEPVENLGALTRREYNRWLLQSISLGRSRRNDVLHAFDVFSGFSDGLRAIAPHKSSVEIFEVDCGLFSELPPLFDCCK